MLDSGEIDILPDVAVSEAREKRFLFHRTPVISSWSVVFEKGDQNISSILDLESRDIAVIDESIQFEELETQAALYGIKPIFHTAKNINNGLDLISTGKANLILLNRFAGSKYMEQYGLSETNVLIRPSILKFAFSKGFGEKRIATFDDNLNSLKNQKDSIYFKAKADWMVIDTKNIQINRLKFFLIVSFIIVIALLAFHKNLKTLVRKLTSDAQTSKDIAQDNYINTLLSLITMVERRDSYTGGHSSRVAQYSIKIAHAAGYSKQDCQTVYEAGVLHDIGKIIIPDSILLKPGKLSMDEFNLIQTHAEIGSELVHSMPMYSHLSLLVHQHHERYDGSGYPNKLKGNEIHPLSRIIAIADSFDAMTTSRIYKARKSVDEALEEINSLAGIHFDPSLIDATKLALSNIRIDDTSQLPESNLEKMRFVYFFNDQVTGLYNYNYLVHIISNHLPRWIGTITVHNLDNYNRRFGWSSGDELLQDYSSFLRNRFPDALLFRINGNDFVVASEEELRFEHQELESVLLKNYIDFECSIRIYDSNEQLNIFLSNCIARKNKAV